MHNFAELLESELRDTIGGHTVPLYKMMAYHLGWEDSRGNSKPPAKRDRSHGLACLVACHAVGGEVDTALPAAASMELANSFSQVHDDVQSGTPSRDNQDAVWWVWGPAQAINAGDGMHALARLTLLRLQERGAPPEIAFKSIQLLDEASLRLCEGRFLDLEAQERIDFDVKTYLEMASGKTGALYACAMRLGAVVASADNACSNTLEACGMNLGLAIQINDDIKALWGNGESDFHPNTEVLNKKKLLPVAYGLEVGDLTVKRKLGEIFFKRVLEKEDSLMLRDILDGVGAKVYCENLVEEQIAKANQAIKPLYSKYESITLVSNFVSGMLS